MAVLLAIHLSIAAGAWRDAATLTSTVVGVVLAAFSQVRSRHRSRDADHDRLVTRVRALFVPVLIADE